MVGGADETTWFQVPVTSAPLVTGLNVVAVEIHQVSPSSSDIGFDLQVVALLQPRLSIVRQGDSLVLRWPAAGAGFHLEYAETIGPFAPWFSHPGVPVLQGAEYEVTETTPLVARFYRLASL